MGEGTWGAFHMHGCERKPNVERDGKWYCGIHDPVKKTKRQDKKEEKWKQERIYNNAKWKREQEQRNRNAVLNQFCEGISTEQIEIWLSVGTLLKGLQEKNVP